MQMTTAARAAGGVQRSVCIGGIKKRNGAEPKPQLIFGGLINYKL